MEQFIRYGMDSAHVLAEARYKDVLLSLLNFVKQLVCLLPVKESAGGEKGCNPVQVIQDRLCVSWLAYS